ncbi:MAG TPA: class II fructose-bisphosphate aldolase [Desulfomicrobiaceae bacterium]|nr:class II fructose-bisphosphate aldolase [Desulfomicrobiaceae bacterium]
MLLQSTISSNEFDRALDVGRPPNIKRLFPHSRALLVSGKVIDRAMLGKGRTMTIAANGRNSFVIRGALRAAQRAQAGIIIEIAKSEGGRNAYCACCFWNLARQVDALCNEMNITVPVAIHADHYAIKGSGDLLEARTEIPSLFDAGITSIAVDASHLPDADNLLANIELAPFIPSWAGYETEVGEIKGKEGLSTPEEALFLIRGLNAHSIFPDWIALNNGTTHGIEAEGDGIQVGLTTTIHDALAPYGVSGAQHGTSGNSSTRLREIATRTRTTKANVATALQMISWGVQVNEYGNAVVDGDGILVKRSGQGMSDPVWEEMVAFARERGITGGNFKKLNLPFENKLLAQSAQVRERMVEGVEAFVYDLLVDVFDAADTAPRAVELLLESGTHDLGSKGRQIETPSDWTEEAIRATAPGGSRGHGGEYDD